MEFFGAARLTFSIGAKLSEKMVQRSKGFSYKGEEAEMFELKDSGALSCLVPHSCALIFNKEVNPRCRTDLPLLSDC